MEWTESRLGERRHRVGAALLLALISLVLYAPTLLFGFVGFDDTRILLGHPHLYNPDSFLASLREILIGHFPREEPLLLRDITWAVEARLVGLQAPWIFHLGNVILNALNTVLLFLFLRQASRRTAFAFAVAFLFVLVPLHVEPVAWIMGRKDLLSAFFLLAALLAQGYELEATTRRAARWFYIAAFVFLMCALFSKVSAVTGFSVLALHRLLLPYLSGVRAPDHPFDLRDSLRRIAPKLLPHTIVSVGVFLWYHDVLSDWGLLDQGGPNGFDPEHLANVLRFFPLTLGFYVRHLLLPSQLSAYYSRPNVELPLSTGETILAIAVAASIIALTVFFLIRRRDLLFYWASFFAFYAPYAGFAYVGFWMADRYLYLSCFCLIALAASAMCALSERLPVLRPLPLLLTLLASASWSIQTWHQMPVWQNANSLWAYEATRDQASLFAQQSHAKRIVAAAEAAASPTERARLIADARSAIDHAIAFEAGLGRGPTSYRTPEQLQLAKIHLLRCRIARLEGRPIEEQIHHAETAFTLAPHRSSARELAALYFNAANTGPPEGREAGARRSFAYFEWFIRLSGPDPKRLAEGRDLLRLYDPGRFPFLNDNIASLRKALQP